MVIRIKTIVNPVSAKTAIHMGNPGRKMERRRIVNFTHKEKMILKRTCPRTFDAIDKANATFKGLSSMITTSALSIARSLPAPPIAIPTSETAMEAASLIPSPI